LMISSRSGNLLISSGEAVAPATRRAVIRQKSGYSRSGPFFIPEGF
jgi:hypothetical protein